MLYVVDLADRRLRVAAEYDGSSHLDRARLRSDRTRHNYLSTRHWRMRYFTDQDLYRVSRSSSPRFAQHQREDLLRMGDQVGVKGVGLKS